MPSSLPAAPSPSSPPPAIRRDLLERLARPLLLRLLAPHEPALAAHAFSLATLAAAPHDDRAPIRALHDLLDDASTIAIATATATATPAADPTLPPLAPLLETLASIARAATPAGREALIKLDTARSLPPRLGPEDLSATACLDHPELFAAVRVPSVVDAIRGFVLYAAAPDREPCFDAPFISSTEAILKEWFADHHRTAYCDILIKCRGPERHFEITHGRTPITHDLIDESLGTKIVTQVSTQRSYAIYNEETRLLAVHSLEFIKNGLRTSFGRGFAGDAAYFAKAEALLDMTPLRDLDTALTPDLGLGIRNVELREIEVVANDGSSGTYCAPKGDLRATGQRRWISQVIAEEGARVSQVKLAVHLGLPRPLLVVIKADRNQLDYDRRDPRAERALLEWLTARGIWHGSRRIAQSASVASAALEETGAASSASA